MGIDERIRKLKRKVDLEPTEDNLLHLANYQSRLFEILDFNELAFNTLISYTRYYLREISMTPDKELMGLERIKC